MPLTAAQNTTLSTFDIADLRDELANQLRDADLTPRRSGDEIAHFCPVCEPEGREPPRKTPSASSTVELGPDGTPALLMHCHKGTCEFADMQRTTGITRRSLESGCEQRGFERSNRPKPAPDASEYTPPAEAELTTAQERLAGSGGMQTRLTAERGWSLLTMIDLGLGLGEDGRVWIPFREDGALQSVESCDLFGGSGRKMDVAKGAERQLLTSPSGIRSPEVFVCEGASDCIAALSRGLAAVGAPAAGIWKPTYADVLVAAGVKIVYVVGDCDTAGRKFDERVRESLTARGIEVRVIDLAPERSDRYDLTDWLLTHGDADATAELVAMAKPYVPSEPADERPPTEKRATERYELVRPSLSNVTPIRWAWRDWLALGIFNLLVGEEGAGKGTLIAYLIARLTSGELDGDLYGEPCMVLILGDEDDFDCVWTPRLHAAGADLDYIRNVRSEHGQALSFPSGIDTLRGFVAETGARLVFFDSLLDNLDAGIDDWRSQQVRRGVGPLRALAKELDFAAIGSLHANKARGGSFRQSVQGSHAFNAISKSSLLVAKHPDGPEERRVVARGKGNYAVRPVSQEFTIVGKSPKIGDHVIRTSVATDFKDSPLTADDLLAPPQREPTSKSGRARAYIQQALSDGQPHDAALIIEYLRTEFDLDARAIRKAREQVGAITEKVSEFQGASTWRLPIEAEQFTRIGRIGRTEDEAA